MRNIITIGLVVLCALLSYCAYDQHKQIEEMQETMENIKTESFQNHLMVDRYEITLELLSEEDSVAAEKFDRIYNKETE